MSQETDPDGLVTTYKYRYGLTEKVKDPTGYTITAYDGNDRPCWTSRAGLSDSVGSPPYSCSTTPAGSETSYTYLADTNAQATVTDPADHTTTYGYGDTAYPTLPTTITDPADEAVTYNTYDANGDLCVTGTVSETSCEWASGDTYNVYDDLGNLSTTEDPLGNQMGYQYADTAFPTQPTATMNLISGSPSDIWLMYYDADSRIYQETEPSDQNIYIGYDADGQKCYEGHSAGTCTSPPEGSGDSNWAYNYDGTVASMTDNYDSSKQATTSYTYDANLEIKSVVDDNGNKVKYAYNYVGKVTCIAYPSSIQNCDGTPSSSNPIVTYGYSTNGLLSSTTDWRGHETTYGYSTDGLNNLDSIDYPTTGDDSVAYGYDVDSHINNLSYGGTPLSSVPSQSWEYNADELETEAVQLDSPTSTYTSVPGYDTSQHRNWVVSNTNPSESSADSYGYNPDGELASDESPSGTTTYSYNGDSELTSSTDPTATYTYTSDGQRCWSADASVSDASCDDPPSTGATGYAWNSYGELCWSGPITEAPSSCGSAPSTATTYTYDGSGNRMTETTGGVTEEFTWNDSSTPLLLEDGTSAYIYGPQLFGGSAPIEQIDLSTQSASYLASGPAGVQMVLKQNGNIDNNNVSSYSTYGMQTNSSDTDCADSATAACTPFGFAGGYTDPDGLIYLIHRYYDPTTGQFLSIDPKVGFTGEPYAYAGDDPLNEDDASGLAPTLEQQLRNDMLGAMWYLTVASVLLSEARDMLDRGRVEDGCCMDRGSEGRFRCSKGRLDRC